MNKTLCIFAASLLAGCAHPTTGRSPLLQSNASVAELNRTANAFTKGQRRESILAIFTLFAQHIEPGFTSDLVATVLLDTSWLSEATWSTRRHTDEIAGQPMWFQPTPDETLFTMTLADDKWRDNLYTCFFMLDGGTGQTKDDAIAFLNGQRGKQHILFYVLRHEDEFHETFGKR